MDKGGTVDVSVISRLCSLDHHLEQGACEWDLSVVVVRGRHDVLLEKHCFVGLCIALVGAFEDPWR